MGFDSIGGYFPNHLNIDNYEIKHEILKILIKNKNFVSNKKEYLKDYSTPLINLTRHLSTFLPASGILFTFQGLSFNF